MFLQQMHATAVHTLQYNVNSPQGLQLHRYILMNLCYNNERFYGRSSQGHIQITLKQAWFRCGPVQTDLNFIHPFMNLPLFFIHSICLNKLLKVMQQTWRTSNICYTTDCMVMFVVKVVSAVCEWLAESNTPRLYHPSVGKPIPQQGPLRHSCSGSYSLDHICLEWSVAWTSWVKQFKSVVLSVFRDPCYKQYN